MVCLVLAELGAGRLFDGVGGDEDSVAVEVSGELPDAPFCEVCDGRECAAHVAVEGAVANGEFGLVAGGEQEGVVVVGVCHEEDASDAGLEVLFGEAVGLVLEGGLQGFPECAEDGLDGDGVGLDAEVLSERCGIVEGALRGEVAGHEQADDIVWSERADGESGSEGGVDAAGESEEGAGEAGLLEVVSDAGDEGLLGEVDRVCGDEVGELDEASEFEGGGGLEEGWHELFGRSIGEHEEAVSVEDEFVVCAYLVEVEDRGLELGGGSCEGGESALDFSSGKGACGEVDEEVGGLGIVERVAPVAGSERGVVAGPEVFADGEDECSAAEGDGCESLSGQEVSGLIEDIVGGEEEFVVSGEDAPVVDE